METFLIRLLQLMLSLTILVFIHELGHFLFARLFKTRVEKFYLFFNPWFSLFKYKPKNSDTEYGIGWLPFGGYTKIAGMIDESMDTEQLSKPAQPWEFRAKPAWQRLLIMAGGVLFNFILALIIYSMILLAWGESYIPVQQAPLGMDFNQTAKNVGFRDGDKLLAADGKPFERYNADLLTSIVDASEVTVERDGKEVNIAIPANMMDMLLKDSVRFADFRTPYVIDSVAEGPALRAGLLAGDSIIALNGTPVSYQDFVEEMQQRRKAHSSDHDVCLTFVRNGVTDTVTVTTDDDFRIGVYIVSDVARLFPVVVKNYNVLTSIPAGIRLGINTLAGYVNQMKYVFSKEGVKQLGGFGTIGKMFPPTWDWHQFWYFTAFLSIILAFMNILPIPALDGGHILFLLVEIVTRRKPSDKFLEYAQIVGMTVLFALLLWANGNDLIRYIFK